MAREMTAPPPLPIPRVSELMMKTSGKVKLIAASEAVPSRLTKKVSVRLKEIIAKMAMIIGMVMRRSASGTEPSISLAGALMRSFRSLFRPLRVENAVRLCYLMR